MSSSAGSLRKLCGGHYRERKIKIFGIWNRIVKNTVVCSIVFSLLGWAGAAPIQGAVLTSVPMQGSMVMPMVSYSATSGKVQVMVDPTIPQLIPLLASNPGDSFDPADPWFDALNPSRQGLAFSRRYGFVMNTASDPLPEGTGIWIRKLSGSPEVGLYRYRSTDPKAWEPIFGTAGSANALYWNGMMFHPAATAPAGTNTYAATFDACLANLATGEVVAGSASQPFTFGWTAVPDGRPALSISHRILVAWPAGTANGSLECADSPSAANWTPLTNAPVVLDGQPTVVLEGAATQKFFRLKITP